MFERKESYEKGLFPFGPLSDGIEHVGNELIDRLRPNPSRDDDEVECFVYPNEVRSGTDGKNAGLRCAWIVFAAGIQPPQLAVYRIDCAGFEQQLDGGFVRVRSSRA